MRVQSICVLSLFCFFIVNTISEPILPPNSDIHSEIDDNGPDLFEITPRNFNKVTDGSQKGTIIIAFIHPLLEQSALLHPILHRLNQYYQYRDDVLVSYADIHRYRSFFVPRFAFKTVPHILAFGKGPNMAAAPVTLSYMENKTFTDYRREMDVLINSMNGLLTVSTNVIDRSTQIIQAVTEQELLPPSSTVHVSVDGSTVAPSSSITTNSSTGTTTNNTTTEDTMEDHVQLLLKDFDAEIDTELAILESAKHRLNYLKSVIHDVHLHGIGTLAHKMNMVRATMLSDISVIPLDVDLEATSASNRNEKFSDIAVLTDIFSSIRKHDKADSTTAKP